MNHRDVKVKAIAAMSENRVIGNSNALPWNVPEDMKHFVRSTKGHTVLMGRKTFLSAPMNGTPLPKRRNIIVTRSPENYTSTDQVQFISDPLSFIHQVKEGQEVLQTDTLWITGGEEIYRLTLPFIDEVVLTIIPGTYEGDAFFPEFEQDFELINEEDIDVCRFLTYRRKQ